MACKEWNHDWIADLYGELDGEPKRRLDAHLAGCAECRSTLEELAGSRGILREAAPAIPTAPRVVMIRPRRLARPFWSFAAGLACASIVFFAGLLAGGTEFLAPEARSTAADPELVTRAELRRIVEERREREATLDGRLASLESQPQPAQAGSDLCLTREQFESYRAEFDSAQQRDFRILAGEIGAVEQRAATWIDENRDALRLALRVRGVDEH